MKAYKDLTLNEQLEIHGIETIGEIVVKLKYKDKSIVRPWAQHCYRDVLKEFGIDMTKDKR